MVISLSAPPHPTAYNEIINSFQDKIKQFHDYQRKIADKTPLADTFDKQHNVGINYLPSQTQKVKSQSGATLNLLLVGQSGLGKTTFINNLFGTSLVPNICNQVDQTTPHISFARTTKITRETLNLVEKDFDLDFTMIDTPGFCDGIDNQFSYVPIIEYIDQQLRLYMFQNEQPDRRSKVDNRVHACLYFINPTSKGLTALDIEALRHISNRVNLIPVIAKSDTLTTKELSELKSLIKSIIDAQEIKICEHIEDDDVRNKILEHIPYSIIGSETFVYKDDGTSVRGRKYDWGIAEVDNEDHCDFVKLKEVLVVNNMIDLISTTELYYERCRDKLIKTRIKHAKEHFGEDDELVKTIDFDNLDSNGLKNYKILAKVDKSFVDDLVIEWNPIFVQKQFIQRKRFNEVISIEEKKFKDWKKALFSKQNVFNDEIEKLSNEVQKLNFAIAKLKEEAKLKATQDYVDNETTSTLSDTERPKSHPMEVTLQQAST